VRSAAHERLSFRDELREELMSKIQDAATSLAWQLVEDEVHELVGSPWSRKDEGSPLRRGGRTRSRILVGGEPVILERTRVRDHVLGREHRLKTFEALASRDALDEDVRALLVRGVSTRNYDGALTNISDGLGLQKSAVSQAFGRASKKDLDDLNGRSLADSTFVAVFMDGVHFAETMCLVVLGVRDDGTKQIVGLREGATENSEVVSDLLSSLVERGLTLPGCGLFVLDGSKALHKAVRDTFGRRAVIQRCQVHKLRNVLSYLPPRWHVETRRRVRSAWGLTSYKDAAAELQRVVRWLQGINEAAANSLREGLEETLTVHRLAVSGALRRTLQTTNPIESAFDSVKSNARRVKRWRNGSMVMRWAGTGLVQAEGRFRRVKGHAMIPALIASLESEAAQHMKSVA
jgi:transposase-like protein